MLRFFRRGRLTAALAAVTLAALCAPGFAQSARAQVYPDTAGLPADIQQAIDYVTARGWMNGGADGNFHPDDPVLRLEYCRALVRLFGLENQATDPNVRFSDLKDTDPDFKYANLAVKYRLIAALPDGSFKPYDAHPTVLALGGLDLGLGLEDATRNAQCIYPCGPAYAGYSIVANDLHLKYRDTGTWPTGIYPRGEMAYSLQRASQVESWRKGYVNDTLSWLRCQYPIVGKERQKALDSAFSKIGYPYVWGGESDAEGGYDCSGLVYFVFQTCLGRPMMRCADDQAADGRYASVGRGELLPGDPIFFYDSSGDGSIGHAGIYLSRGLFIHSTGSNAGVSVDYLDDDGYWSSHFAWGKRVSDEPEPESFDTYFMLMNPAGEPATARLTYMLNDGRQIAQEVDLEPYSRRTVKADDTLTQQEFSTVVDATRGQVIAERSMYFRYLGSIPGGHSNPGIKEAANTWFLAEGCTAYGFDTYVLLQNPNDRAASATLTFMDERGRTTDVGCTIGPFSRSTVKVDDVAGLEQAEFSTRVTSDVPVVVERSMYFDYGGIADGHCSEGVTRLSPDWYFAEGCTGGGFDTYVLLANPSEFLTHVTMTLCGDNGSTAEIVFGVGAHARRTIAIDKIKGWDRRSFSFKVHATQPIVVERAMYFEYNSITGGHDALGAPAPLTRWYLPEGYTAQEFDTYVLLSNPNGEKANVSVRFMRNGGLFTDRSYTVPAHSRFTIAVDKVEGLEASEVSTYIESDLPVVAERSSYFRYQGRAGGSCSPGVSGPSGRWYFAEGYSGR